MSTKDLADKHQQAINELKKQPRVTKASLTKVCKQIQVNPKTVCKIADLKKWKNGKEDYLV